jgi:hypothetical protein
MYCTVYSIRVTHLWNVLTIFADLFIVIFGICTKSVFEMFRPCHARYPKARKGIFNVAEYA